MLDAIHQTLLAHPWAGLLLVALLAWLEYVFPPSPGDSAMLLACFLAGAEALPKSGTYAACLLGSIAGAATAYVLGARLGRSYFFLRSEWAAGELRKFQRGVDRFGPRLLLINRFLPGVRGVFLYGAGIGKLKWKPVLVYSSVGNLLWVALIAWAGTSLGDSWEEVRGVFRRYVWGIGVVLGIYVVVGFVRARRAARLRTSS